MLLAMLKILELSTPSVTDRRRFNRGWLRKIGTHGMVHPQMLLSMDPIEYVQRLVLYRKE